MLEDRAGPKVRTRQMRIYQIDPTRDARWAELVERHPKASVFHTVGWLKALRCTYGYEPVAFTTSSPTGDLKNGLVFCRIDSWLTDRRLVSLPFSDHCEPLCDSADDLNFLIRYLQSYSATSELEISGSSSGQRGFRPYRVTRIHLYLQQCTFYMFLICARI